LKLFEIDRPIIAMLHLPPSPGLSGFPGIMGAMESMRRDLQTYLSAGVDALLLENMHDFPCVPESEMGPEVSTYLTSMAVAARRFADEMAGGAVRPLPIGIQVLFAANRTALAISQAANLQFIRAEGWTHAHVSDKGIAQAQAGKVKRYQHGIGADEIQVFADIKKKHASHALTADLSSADIASIMALHRADGIIVTGGLTGEAPSLEDLAAVRKESPLPLLLGSGLTQEKLGEYFPLADGFIVGSYFKEEGDWAAPVDSERVAEFMREVRRLRENE
jgi:membrane complex biogenesis BtpA family protein